MLTPTVGISVKKTSRVASPATSPSNTAFALRKLRIKGGPFHNTQTVQDLLTQCIPELTPERVRQVITSVQANHEADILTCPEHKAHKYCQSLVENGLYAFVDE